jgi:hypothetical protein
MTGHIKGARRSKGATLGDGRCRAHCAAGVGWKQQQGQSIKGSEQVTVCGWSDSRQQSTQSGVLHKKIGFDHT